jgi:transposase
MGRLRIARRGPGRPRTRPGKVLADKAYSSAAIRRHLRTRKITAVIPEPADQAPNRRKRGNCGGRPPAFDPEAYKQRNTVERAFCRLASTALSRPATSETSSTAAPSTSQPSGSGSATSRLKIYGTRPSSRCLARPDK